MKRYLRDYGVPAVLLLVKALTTLRTGLDTYAISGNLIDVLLLDGVFLSLWLLLAYGGDSQAMRRLKPFATAGAFGMYLFMLYVGWEAHHSIVSIGVRIAGGVALVADIWDYVAARYDEKRKARQARRQAERRRSELGLAVYYDEQITRRLRRSVARAARRLSSHMDVAIFERARAGLPEVIDAKLHDGLSRPAPRQVVGAARQLPDITRQSPGNGRAGGGQEAAEAGQIVDLDMSTRGTFDGKLSKDERQSELLLTYSGQTDRELAALFGVNERTIRRDKAELGLS